MAGTAVPDGPYRQDARVIGGSCTWLLQLAVMTGPQANFSQHVHPLTSRCMSPVHAGGRPGGVERPGDAAAAGGGGGARRGVARRRRPRGHQVPAAVRHALPAGERCTPCDLQLGALLRQCTTGIMPSTSMRNCQRVQVQVQHRPLCLRVANADAVRVCSCRWRIRSSRRSRSRHSSCLAPGFLRQTPRMVQPSACLYHQLCGPRCSGGSPSPAKACCACLPVRQTKQSRSCCVTGAAAVEGPLPFNDAGNPVMAQVAFLTAMVSPKIAAAAAQRALEVSPLRHLRPSCHLTSIGCSKHKVSTANFVRCPQCRLQWLSCTMHHPGLCCAERTTDAQV